MNERKRFGRILGVSDFRFLAFHNVDPLSAEFPTEAEPEIGFTSRFQFFTNLARRHFHAGRGGRAKLAISTSLVSRVVTTAISFVVLPISIRYLGNEGYGLMTTVTAVVGWLQFTNMGIGLGLQNALTEEVAKGNKQAQKELVSTAFFSLCAIGLVLFVSGLIAFPHITWTRVFPPTSSRFTAEIPWTVLTVFFGFISTIILGFVNPIYAARQELHIGSIQAMITSLLILLGTFTAVHFRWGLLGLTICTIGVTADAMEFCFVDIVWPRTERTTSNRLRLESELRRSHL
jgi:O-antigen/teichoic acid export membrane protein